MPAKKTSHKRSAKTSVVDIEEYPQSQPEMPEMYSMMDQPRKPRFMLLALVVVVLAIVAALILRNKELFVAATVNGMPIPRWELNDKLTQRFGNQILETMIGERLITAEATKQGVTVSQAELDAKIAEIESTLQGQMSLDDALELQGITKSEFESQIRVQILIDKLLASEVSVTASEVDDYIASNSAYLTATEPAQQRIEAEEQLRSNKTAEKFQVWFADLKEKANIQRFVGEIGE
ncbi:hypothetical protein C4579_04195 [Candidatus Microgenomates bacterium]|nr:MAG: hypothetical protein C4579_04195 [Candidatus Microgenomates bacterium]